MTKTKTQTKKKNVLQTPNVCYLFENRGFNFIKYGISTKKSPKIFQLFSIMTQHWNLEKVWQSFFSMDRRCTTGSCSIRMCFESFDCLAKQALIEQRGMWVAQLINNIITIIIITIIIIIIIIPRDYTNTQWCLLLLHPISLEHSLRTLRIQAFSSL